MPERISEEQLREIELRCEAASPGPWNRCKANEDKGCSCGLVWSTPVDAVVAKAYSKDDDGHWTSWQYMANWKFIAASREDLPACVREIRRLQEERDELKVLNEKMRKARAAVDSMDCGELAECIAEAVQFYDSDDLMEPIVPVIKPLIGELKELREENERLRELLKRIDTTLTVPAAEYVPAISDAFTLIDEALGKERVR